MTTHFTAIALFTLALSALSAPINFKSELSEASLSPRAVKYVARSTLTGPCTRAGKARDINGVSPANNPTPNPGPCDIAGQVPDSNTGACTPCSRGSYANSGDLTCTPCAIGTHVNTIGATSCLGCSGNTVALITGLSLCITPLIPVGPVRPIPCVKKGFSVGKDGVCIPFCPPDATISGNSCTCNDQTKTVFDRQCVVRAPNECPTASNMLNNVCTCTDVNYYIPAKGNSCILKPDPICPSSGYTRVGKNCIANGSKAVRLVAGKSITNKLAKGASNSVVQSNKIVNKTLKSDISVIMPVVKAPKVLKPVAQAKGKTIPIAPARS